MSKQQDIIDAIKTALLAITPGNGYSFDIADNVFEWRDPALNSSELPAIIIRDHEDEISHGDTDEHNLNIDIEVVNSGSDDLPADIRTKAQDALTAIGTLKGNQYIAGIQYDGMLKGAEHKQERIMSAILKFIIWYYTAEFKI